MIAYPATNSLIITDAVPNIRKMESLIRSLDVPASEGKGKINVYYLKHANSEDFAKVMSALVSAAPGPAGGRCAAGRARDHPRGAGHDHFGQGHQLADRRRVARATTRRSRT